MSKYSVGDVPPPGGGLVTVTQAVPAAATLAAGTVAVNCEPLTKVVANGVPFQFTVAPDTNPVPFTVRVKPGLPGVTAAGTSGWLTNGTGLAWPSASELVVMRMKISNCNFIVRSYSTVKVSTIA
jgi:hypothetical protein